MGVDIPTKSDVRPLLKWYKYRYRMCLGCLNKLNEGLVKKTWTYYYPSNLCIAVYIVVFFIRSVWRRYFSGYVYYGVYSEF